MTGTRSRWVALVAGLAAGAVAVGGGVLAAGWLATGRHPGPTAQGGRAGPVGPGDTATTSSGSASASAVPGPSGSASADSSAPAGTEVAVGPLRLTLPEGWSVGPRTSRGGRTSACLRQRATPANCDLLVTVVDDPATGPMSVDYLGGMMSPEPEVCTPDTWRAFETTAYVGRTVGGRPAEYRAYRVSCAGQPDRHPEQWTVPTWPAVQLSAYDLRPVVRDDVHAIVAGARFTEPDTGRRVTDVGYLTGHSVDAGGTAHLQLDRTIRAFGGDNNGRDVNDNPATYDYRLARTPVVRDTGMLCADTEVISGRSCALADVFGRIDQHRTGPVQLVFDRDGVVVGIVGEYRP